MNGLEKWKSIAPCKYTYRISFFSLNIIWKWLKNRDDTKYTADVWDDAWHRDFDHIIINFFHIYFNTSNLSGMVEEDMCWTPKYGKHSTYLHIFLMTVDVLWNWHGTNRMKKRVYARLTMEMGIWENVTNESKICHISTLTISSIRFEILRQSIPFRIEFESIACTYHNIYGKPISKGVRQARQ